MKNKDNVMISLTSVQWQDDEKSETELLTKANFSQSGDNYVISYNDTEATGFEGSVTTITINGNKSASIVRMGTAASVLSLETGKKHYCQYGTPFGSVQLGIYTHSIRNSINKDGKLYMKYTLDVNSSLISDNEIILTINQ